MVERKKLVMQASASLGLVVVVVIAAGVMLIALTILAIYVFGSLTEM